MASFVARAAVAATVATTIPVINNIVHLVSTVKKLTTHEEIKDWIDDLDIDATVSIIALACKTHDCRAEDFMLARKYVEDALKVVKFDLETIYVKNKLHKEGWVSRWRVLNIKHEKRKLGRSMKILKSRFDLMWNILQQSTVPNAPKSYIRPKIV